MDEKELQVTYTRFGEQDDVSADSRRKMNELNEYVFAHLPLEDEQKSEFLQLLRAEQAREEHEVKDSDVV